MFLASAHACPTITLPKLLKLAILKCPPSIHIMLPFSMASLFMFLSFSSSRWLDDTSLGSPLLQEAFPIAHSKLDTSSTS